MKKLFLVIILSIFLVGCDTLTGDQGERGEQGEQGIQGETGSQGIQGKQGEKGESAEAVEFTGTLRLSIWDNEEECWYIYFDTDGNNDFILIVEVGFIIFGGESLWFEPPFWFYSLDTILDEVVVVIYPSEVTPLVQSGFDYRIVFVYTEDKL